MEIVVVILTAVATALLLAFLNANTSRHFRDNPRKGGWTRENMAKGDARLGYLLIVGVGFFLVVSSLPLVGFTLTSPRATARR